ncbi:hypothetical protein ARMGADRAFT_1089445 [Armillaria gallica]|uniref:Uncharacterized protein n=1 Tax=Armillaria gallica TaxID=47427 RepID=A0A2H3D4S2_ARMGA|nr:hypothetical protein ARMGADRAFT_1089445 [Armillaria gallica]
MWAYVDQQLEPYYETYHYSLNLDQEPLLPCRNPKEILTPEEQQYKRAHTEQMCGVLYRWWEWHASKMDGSAVGVTDLPLAELLTEVTAAQIWSKDDFLGAVQDEFNTWFATTGLPERFSLGKRGQWTADYFKKLPVEVQEPYEKQAAAEKAQSQKKKGGNESADAPTSANKQPDTEHGETPLLVPAMALSLEETMRVLNNIGTVAYPWAHTQVKEARSMLSHDLHYGWNKDPRPKDWHEVGRGKAHDQAMEMFVRFAKTCFSPEQMSAQSFQKSTELEDLDTKEDKVEVSNNEAPANEAEEPSPNKSKSKKKRERKGSKRSKQPKGNTKGEGEGEDEDNAGLPAKCAKTHANEGNNLENGNNSPITPNDAASSSSAMPSDPSNPVFLLNIDPSLQQHLAHFALPA